MKKVALLVLGIGVSLTISAQKGVDDGSKYGHGEDSIRCIQNLSLYRTYAKQNDFQSALEFWEIAYNECPAANLNLYIDGAKIRAWQVAQEKDPAKKMEKFQLLMQLYEQRAKYFGNNPKAPVPYIQGQKALDYFKFHPQGNSADKKPVYPWLKECIDWQTSCIEKGVSSQFNPAWPNFFILASRAMLDDENHREQFLSDYLQVCDLLDAKIAETPDTTVKARYRGFKSDIDALFVNSGVADCATLENMFGSQLEANKGNLDWLKKVVSVFKRARCTETETYFAASQYAHQLQPTAETAEGCAYMCIKKEDYKQAAAYLNEAISLETSEEKKADYEYVAASALFAAKRYAEARDHALKAAQYRSGFADPYILIAKMYANSVDQYDDPVTRRAVYWVAVDKLEKAKSVDPSTADDLNVLIAKYKEQFPTNEDVFMHPDVDDGKPYLVKGWINEKTIARAKK